MTTAAQHSIHYQLLEPAHLIPGKRQRQLKGVLFIVHQGAGLLQLGPHSYVLGKEDAVFLPADTLFTWHTLAHSRISRLAFSPRLVQPRQAGLLTDAPLLLAGSARLANWPSAALDSPSDWQGAYGRLCRVLHDELQHLTPQPLSASSHKASLSKLQQMIGANLVNFDLTKTQEAEFQSRFTMLPADFKRQTTLLTILRELGKSADWTQLVQRYGFNSVAEFEQNCSVWLAS
ncbi:hypothetical protein [Oceanisphaera sp. W20_SRM_FM3]|uniref:hypothetical protein n=1 Tax=Oceanisphaera sp. W20_SRM_FM3 TaxID=3240267 RepID=UPI003F9A848F